MPQNYHWILEKGVENWTAMAVTSEDVLKIYEKKIGAQLEICKEPDQYVLTRLHQVDGSLGASDHKRVFHVKRRGS